MASFRSFLDKLDESSYNIVKEEETKSLAKEDALSLIATFVKDVKKKFTKPEDRVEILGAASKTLDFYINEIEKEEEPDFGSDTSSFDFDETPPEGEEPEEETTEKEPETEPEE